MKENYKKLPWHSREIVDHQYPLTDNEKLELAENMANARAEVVRLEDELAAIKKSFKERIDMHTGEFSQAAFKKLKTPEEFWRAYLHGGCMSVQRGNDGTSNTFFNTYGKSHFE